MSCADETVKIIGRMLEAERAGAKFPAPHEPGFDVCETVQVGSYAGMPLFEVIGMDGDSRMQAVIYGDGAMEEMKRPVLPDEAGRDDELKPTGEPGPWPGGMDGIASVERDPVDDALRILQEYVRVPYNRKLGREESARATERTDPQNREMMKRVLLAGSPGADAERRVPACEPRVGAREGRVPGLVSRIEDATVCLRAACVRVAHEPPVSVRRDIEGALRWLATALEEASALRDELPGKAHLCTCDHVEGCEGCAPDCRFEALLRQQLASRYPIEPRSDADAGSS